MIGDRGVFVVLVGPDGVGKTSVAAELLSTVDGRYFHFRPPLRRKWTLPTPGEFTTPTPPQRTGAVVSALRIGKTLASFWIGYLLSVRPEVKAGRVVVADRWAYGYVVHPWKLGVVHAPQLTKTMIRVLPQPDVVFLLEADPMTIHARKAELSPQQAAVETEAWASLPIRPLIRVNADEPIDRVVDTILAHLQPT